MGSFFEVWNFPDLRRWQFRINGSRESQRRRPYRYDGALLIDALEPSQNKTRGEDFSTVEFLQTPDPQIKKNQMKDLADKFKKTLK